MLKLTHTQVMEVKTQRALLLCVEIRHYFVISHDEITYLRLSLHTETSCNVCNRSCGVAVVFHSYFWPLTGQVSLHL